MIPVALILGAVRALALVAPVVIREGHGERVSNILNTIATLGERGQEGYEDLKALTAKLEAMNGVERDEKEKLWAELESTHNAIQEAAKSIPQAEASRVIPKPTPAPTPDPRPDPQDPPCPGAAWSGW